MDLAVLTSLCDANRVIFMKMPSSARLQQREVHGRRRHDEGLEPDAHSISHRIGNAVMGGQCVADAIAHDPRDRQVLRTLFAYLVGRLDMFTEGDVKLLDNTATVWFQEMSDGNSHNLNNMPILQAGSCGGYFKTGWAINVEGAKTDMSRGTATPTARMGSLRSTAWTASEPRRLATHADQQVLLQPAQRDRREGRLDGYAAPGGTAPVTKFGKYDDTKLFSDGGTKPSVIASRGVRGPSRVVTRDLRA